MEVLLSSSSSVIPPAISKAKIRSNNRALEYPSSGAGVVFPKRGTYLTRKLGLNGKKCMVIEEVSVAADPSHVEITWQIIVGAIAGVTPFIVAGIEFSKRIAAQRRCNACKGSGLVMMEKEYFRCPECGGFLPWQSWKRFFTG